MANADAFSAGFLELLGFISWAIGGCSIGFVCETSMTIPDSHESASDETGRPAETSDPSVAQEGWAVDGFLYDAFISYSRRDLDASDKIEPDLL